MSEQVEPMLSGMISHLSKLSDKGQGEISLQDVLTFLKEVRDVEAKNAKSLEDFIDEYGTEVAIEKLQYELNETPNDPRKLLQLARLCTISDNEDGIQLSEISELYEKALWHCNPENKMLLADINIDYGHHLSTVMDNFDKAVTYFDAGIECLEQVIDEVEEEFK